MEANWYLIRQYVIQLIDFIANNTKMNLQILTREFVRETQQKWQTHRFKQCIQESFAMKIRLYLHVIVVISSVQLIDARVIQKIALAHLH
jgi:hypothetical protein